MGLPGWAPTMVGSSMSTLPPRATLPDHSLISKRLTTEVSAITRKAASQAEIAGTDFEFKNSSRAGDWNRALTISNGLHPHSFMHV